MQPQVQLVISTTSMREARVLLISMTTRARRNSSSKNVIGNGGLDSKSVLMHCFVMKGHIDILLTSKEWYAYAHVHIMYTVMYILTWLSGIPVQSVHIYLTPTHCVNYVYML